MRLSRRCVPIPSFFFFFQAEDGIRDKLVTGVQTCALPISFRRDLRSWLEENVPRDLGPERTAGLPEDERIRRLRAWQRRMAEARWVGITWPREYGGRDAGIPQQLVYVEEKAGAGAPGVIGNLGIGIAGP